MPSSPGAVIEGTRTFLFADLRDYTGFVERHGDQAAAALVAAYRSLIRQKVQESAGAEIKVEGDAVFVAFPSARLAIVCGAAILKEAAERTAAQPDLPIQVGIGVHAGEPVPQDGDFIGAAVNVAARIGATAGTGQLLVSDVVRGLIRTGAPFPLQDRGSVSLKGISEPVHLYEVVWSSDQSADIAPLVETAPLPVPQPPHTQRDSTPLVGRDRELAELRAWLGRLGQGQGQGGTVMVAGDAGIGKSRFLREALFDRTQVPVLLFATCGLSEAPAPYEPLVGIVRSILRAPDGEPALARVAPELLALTPEVSTSHQGAPDRDRLFGAVLRVLRHYAHTAPTVFAIDDLHWADEVTLAMMQFLMAEAEATPYLVVGAYRGDELHRRHRLRPFLAALSRRPDAATIALTALASEQSLQLLHGLPTLKDAPPSELAAINQRAEGNPFFLEELAQTAQSGQAGTVPASVAETVLQRMVRVGDTGARLLTYLAVIGRRAGYDILEALMGAEAALIDGARAGVEQYLVVEDGDGLAFRHALIREAILGDLMARERRALHRTVAEAIERLHGDSSEWAGDIAHNFGGAGLPDRAFPYAMKAGDRALHLSANEEAARLYEHAVEWSAASTLDRMRALEGLGRAYARLLFARKAMATYDEALELARALGSQEDVARLTMRRAFVMPWGREEYAYWQAAWATSEPLDHPATLARLAQGLARRAYLYFEDDRGEAWLRRGLVEAHRAGSRERALWSMRLQLQYEHRIGWQAEEERLVREQLEIALASDDSVLDAYSDLYVRRCRDADDAEREGILQAGRAYADRLAIPAGMVFKYGFAWVSWLTGNWPQARALWDAVRARWSDDAGAIYPSAGPIAASIDVEMIGPDSAAKPLMEATNRMRKTETWRALLWAPAHDANVWLATDRAERVLEGLMPTFARRPPSMLDPEDFALVSRVVLPAALLTGDRGALAWWIDDPVVSAGGALYQAAVDHALAIAALLEDDAIAADAAFERAATAYFDRGWMLLGHELAWQWAQTDSAGAHQALTAARGFYEERGATWRLHWLTDRQPGPMGETSRQ